MKIVLNALQYKQNSSGIGLMICNLYERFLEQNQKDDIKILLSQDSPQLHFSREKTEIVRFSFQKSQYILRNLYELFFLGICQCKNSVLVTTDSKAPLLLPRNCHVIPIVTDLAVFRMGEVYQASRKIYWKMLYRNLVKKAEHFIAISEFTKKEMIELLHIPPEKIDVAYCASNHFIRRIESEGERKKVCKKYNLPENYILFVGNFNPRKNLERILLAFDQLKQQNKIQEDFVIVGEKGWKFDKDSVLAQMKRKDHVFFTGYVSDEDLSALYSQAKLFVFCTLYEGFGIPIIEAQKCGVPVLLSETSCFREVGGAGGVYVDCYQVDAIGKGMEEILSNPQYQKQLIKQGLENAKRFSWENSAQKLIELVNFYSQS